MEHTMEVAHLFCNFNFQHECGTGFPLDRLEGFRGLIKGDIRKFDRLEM